MPTALYFDLALFCAGSARGSPQTSGRGTAPATPAPVRPPDDSLMSGRSVRGSPPNSVMGAGPGVASYELVVAETLQTRRIAMAVADAGPLGDNPARKGGAAHGPHVRRRSIKGESMDSAVSALSRAIQANAAAVMGTGSGAAGGAAGGSSDLTTFVKTSGRKVCVCVPGPRGGRLVGAQRRPPAPLVARAQVIAKSESEMLAVAEALGRNFLFSGLPWDEKRVIIDAMERIKVAGGQVVVEQARQGRGGEDQGRGRAGRRRAGEAGERGQPRY